MRPRKMITYPHRPMRTVGVFSLFSLVGALPFVLCGFSHAAGPMNAFYAFFNRAKPIMTVRGQVVTVERQLATLTFPIKITIEGALPQGEVDLFAMAAYGKDQVALAIPSTGNPFTDPVKWEVNFFQWLFSDRLIPYRTITNTGTKYVVDGYATLIREHLTANKVTSLLFAISPAGEVQKWRLENAHIVRVNIK